MRPVSRTGSSYLLVTTVLIVKSSLPCFALCFYFLCIHHLYNLCISQFLMVFLFISIIHLEFILYDVRNQKVIFPQWFTNYFSTDSRTVLYFWTIFWAGLWRCNSPFLRVQFYEFWQTHTVVCSHHHNQDTQSLSIIPKKFRCVFWQSIPHAHHLAPGNRWSVLCPYTYFCLFWISI